MIKILSVRLFEIRYAKRVVIKGRRYANAVEKRNKSGLIVTFTTSPRLHATLQDAVSVSEVGYSSPCFSLYIRTIALRFSMLVISPYFFMLIIPSGSEHFDGGKPCGGSVGITCYKSRKFFYASFIVKSCNVGAEGVCRCIFFNQKMGISL